MRRRDSLRHALRQGAGVEELLKVFDAVRATHEAMDPEAFNDDGTYKTHINQVHSGGPPLFSYSGYANKEGFHRSSSQRRGKKARDQQRAQVLGFEPRTYRAERLGPNNRARP